MKKFILALAALSMVATPAMAQYRGGQHRGYDRYERHEGNRHNRGVSTGEAVAVGIGALILGAAISNGNRNNRYERYEQPNNRRAYQYVCQDVIQYDYYGNPYVAARNCFYQ